ncbi:hypothetical protein A2466_00550 [Candidatus Falkowbacteria bacterium RIFOXYC2_FULL_34_220]|nr:MAG: hypothetical protein A2466_00550 [Candidatus Falkowbacteria bacterium RIFOXYC2_FULL_34_220]
MILKKSTEQAMRLCESLIKRGVRCQKEKWDNHKHIDLSIDEARLYIEVDGDYHYTSSRQIKKDIVRDYYSSKEGFRTIHIPNRLIDDKLDNVADAIEQVVKDCIEYAKKQKQNLILF